MKRGWKGRGFNITRPCWRGADGGKIVSEDCSVRIEAADAVTFILAIGTSFINYHD
jgi:hypothetical protein